MKKQSLIIKLFGVESWRLHRMKEMRIFGLYPLVMTVDIEGYPLWKAILSNCFPFIVYEI